MGEGLENHGGTSDLSSPVDTGSPVSLTGPFSINPLDEATVDGVDAGFVFAVGARGRATSNRYGIAFSQREGTANAGASGVAFTRNNGTSSSGDGGVSVAHHYGDAECGHHGVAYSQNPGGTNLGAVRGAQYATLVISWVVDQMTYSKSVRVGDTVDCLQIRPYQWYSVDPENGYCWYEVTRD